MTRAVLLLSVSLAALGVAGARAQDLRDIQARNAAAHALEDARRDLLSSQIEASNANERARTQTALRDLDAQRAGAPNLRPLTAPPARPLDEPARREAELSRSMDRMERLTQDALAQSNARMLAIRPASEPKQVGKKD
ncbi:MULTISPECIES: hypothetical protein [unclassified Caulobacter]|jgi:hypothetical protein|uniref:hypothetical protein n=1 Tax=unclassified Caulobacter TaxID=2648921 RepID=UPI0006F8A781|nr:MULTISPECIES: hypothetical protein [unclassified Caulobacter]KQV58221.1 hypothetical protein ASC62_05295 [Caulobacter sp. Root342]KQV69274.1 hypothetical protein ASC70_10740 [Caulobacter sp. Root343]